MKNITKVGIICVGGVLGYKCLNKLFGDVEDKREKFNVEELYDKEWRDSIVDDLGVVAGKIYINWYIQMTEEVINEYYGKKSYTKDDLDRDSDELATLMKSKIDKIIGVED